MGEVPGVRALLDALQRMRPMQADEARTALLALIPDRARELRLWQKIARESYEQGYAAGWREGYERGARVLEAEWPKAVEPLMSGAPDFAELEQRRWTVRGEQRTRDTFGDPHPDDYVPKTNNRLEKAS